MKNKLSKLPPSIILPILASVASFYMGYNLSVFNISYSTISSYFEWCGPPVKISTSLKCVNLMCDDSLKKHSMLHGSFLISAAFGSLLAGPIMSRFGRRLALLMSLYGMLFSVVVGCASTQFVPFLLSRVATGILSGMATVMPGVYMTEMAKPSNKGLVGFIPQVAVNIGILCGMLMGLPLYHPKDLCDKDSNGKNNLLSISNNSWNFNSYWWRIMLGAPIPLCCLSIVFLAYVYTFDTPTYLRAIQKVNSAVEAEKQLGFPVEIVYTENCLKEITKNCNGSKKINDERLNNDQNYCNIVYKLSWKNSWNKLIIGWILAIAHQLTGINVFIASSHTIFASAKLPTWSLGLSTLLIGLIGVVCAVISAFFISNIPRRSMLIYGAAGMAISFSPIFICTNVFNIHPTSTSYHMISLLSILMFIIAYGLSYGPGLFPYLTELYPLNVKDLGLGIAYCLNWLTCCFVVSFSRLLTLREAYAFFGISCFCATLFAFSFAPETLSINSSQQNQIKLSSVI